MSIDVTLVTMEDNRQVEVFSWDLTGNLTSMANEAGLYEHLWHRRGLHLTHAQQLIAPLSEALIRLEADPEYFKQYDAKNKWGVYAQFVEFVKSYLEACEKTPGATFDY